MFHDFVGGMADYREIIEVLKEADDRGSNFGGVWHSDVAYLEEPALGSILYARDVPDFGGDTLFANMYLAYDALSLGMKRMLDGMTAMHSARRPYGPRSDWFPTDRAMDIRRSNSAQAEVEHPVIRTHPETERKGLFVNSTFTIRFNGMSEEESAPARLSLSPPGAARIHLPLALERQRNRLLGQPIASLAADRPEPALLLGEPVYQEVDERAHLGGQMPAMGIERIDFALLRPVAGQQRHQRSRGQQVLDQKRRSYHQPNPSHGGGAGGFGAATDQAPRYARRHRVAASIQKAPPVLERRVGVAQAVVAGEIRWGLRR
jgi:hypothetical protein